MVQRLYLLVDLTTPVTSVRFVGNVVAPSHLQAGVLSCANHMEVMEMLLLKKILCYLAASQTAKAT